MVFALSNEKQGSHVEKMMSFPSKVNELFRAWVLPYSSLNVASKNLSPMSAKPIKKL
jgi:hypothetical protein